MATRYLQSMASKCLIIGIKPVEMDELFDYEPMIEIDPVAPESQLDRILSNFSDYIPMIERNYREVCRAHTWKNRWADIVRIIYGRN